jgi:hypothetical protein
MFSNLPLIIQEYINTLNDPKQSMSARYNYYMMLVNIVAEINPSIEKYKKQLDKQRVWK